MQTLRRWYWYLLFCVMQGLAVLPAANAASDSLQEIPPLTGPVIDTTGTLDADQQARLSQKLRALHDKYGAQMQVLIVASSAPEDAFAYSLRAVEKWKLGTAKVDDGLLLFIAKDDRRSQMQVGYGLEGTIPDVVASRLLNAVMAPYFRQGDYYGGINAVVDAVYQRISGAIPADQQAGANPGNDDVREEGISLFVILIAGIVFIKILRGVTGNIIAPLAGAPLVFAFVWLVIGWTLVAAVGVAFMALMLAWIPNDVWFFLLATSRQGRAAGGFGGGGFGGGGGNWSGGGGGFGGGGASGRW